MRVVFCAQADREPDEALKHFKGTALMKAALTVYFGFDAGLRALSVSVLIYSWGFFLLVLRRSFSGFAVDSAVGQICANGHHCVWSRRYPCF